MIYLTNSNDNIVSASFKPHAYRLIKNLVMSYIWIIAIKSL